MKPCEVFGRGERICTFDPCVPNAVRYRAALRPNRVRILERNRIVLHQRVETQAVRLGHAAAGDFTLREVHALRQSGIGTDRRIHA